MTAEGEDVATIWGRIDAWLTIYAPELQDLLRPGVSAGQLARAERALDIAFPLDFRAWLRLHDGENEAASGLFGVTLYPLDKMVHTWQALVTARQKGTFRLASVPIPHGPGVRGEFWNPRWIPITDDGAGNHLCLDLDPIPPGHVGQILLWWQDRAERMVRTPSFAKLLGSLADALEGGHLVATERQRSFFALLSPGEVASYADITVRTDPKPRRAVGDALKRTHLPEDALRLMGFLKEKGYLDPDLGHKALLFGSRLRAFLKTPFPTKEARAEELCAWLKRQPEVKQMPLSPVELFAALKKVWG
jgi:cell wall assembly regulator SMI1